MLGADTPENMEVVGKDGVTVRNVSIFLSLLEERVTDILQVLPSPPPVSILLSLLLSLLLSPSYCFHRTVSLTVSILLSPRGARH
jgi:hypothetical protein